VIIESGNDYVIGVKQNQQKLYKQVQQITHSQEHISGWYIDMAINKGRTEYRAVSVSDYLGTISKEWRGLKQLIKVHRIVKTKKESREQIAYYISSKKSNALLYSEGTRLHWSIENCLHWVKDVTFGEDASKIRTRHAPQNMSTFRNMAINIFRKNNYNNLAQAKRLVANDIPLLMKLIS
jgi:predicted transposase YbfD/YdcC